MQTWIKWEWHVFFYFILTVLSVESPSPRHKLLGVFWLFKPEVGAVVWLASLEGSALAYGMASIISSSLLWSTRCRSSYAPRQAWMKKKNLNHESKVLKIPPLQQETIERMVWTIFFYNLKWRSVLVGRPGKIFWTRKWWELRRHDDPFLVICHKHFFRDIVGSDIRLSQNWQQPWLIASSVQALKRPGHISRSSRTFPLAWTCIYTKGILVE